LKHPDLIYSELNTQPQTKSLIPPPEQPTDVQYSTFVHDAEKRSTDDIHWDVSQERCAVPFAWCNIRKF